MAEAREHPDRDLRVTPELIIPAAELDWSFQTSGGPGGQHANRSATGATLTWEYRSSPSLTEDQRDRLAAGLGNRGAGGVVRVVADRSRSQWRNRGAARTRLAQLVRDALAVPKKRRPTTPTKASRQRRLDAKKRRSRTKRQRRPPELE